jgi:hypothetical protein
MSVLLSVSVSAIATASLGMLVTLITWFRTRQIVLRAEAETRVSTKAHLNRAVEVDLLRGPQSRIDTAEAKALSEVIDAIGNTAEAVIQIGSIVLLKTGGTVIARSLNVRELRYLEQHKDLLQRPAAMLEAFDDPATPFSPRAAAGEER